MATRGSVVVGGKRYVISYDAYPSHAREVIKKVLKTKPKSRKEFIRRAKKYGLDIEGRASRKFRYPFEEYRYIVKIRKKRVKTVIPKPKKRKKKRR